MALVNTSKRIELGSAVTVVESDPAHPNFGATYRSITSSATQAALEAAVIAHVPPASLEPPNPANPAVALNTAAGWAASNPVLAAGQMALETDTGVVKIGDGVTAYASLPALDVSGKVIAEVSITASVTGIQAIADVAGLTGLVVPDLAFPVDLQFWSVKIFNDTVAGITVPSICKSDNTAIGSDNHYNAIAGTNGGKASTVWASLPAHSAGTYKMRAQRVTAVGSGTIFADANNPARLRAIAR
jgi:hypothetical protein